MRTTRASFDFGIEVPPDSLAPERSLAVEAGLRLSARRLDFEWRMTKALSVSGFVATTYGRQTAADIPLRRIPPANGYLAARHRRRPGLWAEARVRAARTQDRLASDQRIPPGGTPGWVVANLAPGVPIGRRVTVTGGLANVFDEAAIDSRAVLWVNVRAGF